MGRQSIYFTSWPCFSLVSSTTRRAPRGRDLCLFCSLLSTTEPGPYSAFRKSLLSGWCGQFKEIFTQLFQVCLTLRQCRGFLKLLRTQFFSFLWSFTSYQDACDDLLSLSFGISVTLCPLSWTRGQTPFIPKGSGLNFWGIPRFPNWNICTGSWMALKKTPKPQFTLSFSRVTGQKPPELPWDLLGGPDHACPGPPTFHNWYRQSNVLSYQGTPQLPVLPIILAPRFWSLLRLLMERFPLWYVPQSEPEYRGCLISN